MLLRLWLPLLLVVGLVGKTSNAERSRGTAAATTRKPTTLGWNPRKAYAEEKTYSYEGSYEKKKNYDNDRSDNYNPYDDDDDDYDRKPSRPRKVYKKKPDSVGSMNIYIREKGKKKGSYKKYRVPAARYNHKKHRNFGSLVSLAPWLPILVDRLTKQTFFITPVGGIIVVPPIVNFIGKVIPIAHLILSGYASLVSTGAPLAPGVDVAPLVSNTPVTGPNVPKIDPNTGDFKGAVRVDYEPPKRADPPVYGDRINPPSAPQLIYSEPDYQQPPPPPPPQFQQPPPPPPPRQFQPDRPVYGGGQAQPADPFPQPNYPNPIDGNDRFGAPRSSFDGQPQPAYPPVIAE